jgi:large subunit ribosomal protein L4e
MNRGHKVNAVSQFPIVVSNDIESISKTKELRKILVALGLEEDLNRARFSFRSRSGVSRRRGRPARSGTSALIVVENDKILGRLSGSIPGVEIKQVQTLSVLDLAPGSKPIRLTIFSQNAIEKLKSLKVPILKVMEIMRAR